MTSGKVKSTIKNQDTLHSENTLYSVLHKKKNIECFFRGAPKIQGQISFEHGIWATSVKSTSKIQDIFYFENYLYRVLHERGNIAAFSVEHQKFPERKKNSSGMWVASNKLK